MSSRRTALSPQTTTVLRLLTEAPDRWWHGYDMARRTGLKSGTLYPILMRLNERGLLDAEWEQDPPAGRPRRHRYRLTAEGIRIAEALPAPKPATLLEGRALPGNAFTRAAANSPCGRVSSSKRSQNP